MKRIVDTEEIIYKEVPVIKEVIKKVPRNIVIEKVVNVPVEKVVEIPRRGDGLSSGVKKVYKQKPIERIKHVEEKIIKKVIKEVPQEIVVDKYIEDDGTPVSAANQTYETKQVIKEQKIDISRDHIVHKYVENINQNIENKQVINKQLTINP